MQKNEKKNNSQINNDPENFDPEQMIEHTGSRFYEINNNTRNDTERNRVKEKLNFDLLDSIKDSEELYNMILKYLDCFNKKYYGNKEYEQKYSLYCLTDEEKYQPFDLLSTFSMFDDKTILYSVFHEYCKRCNIVKNIDSIIFQKLNERREGHRNKEIYNIILTSLQSYLFSNIIESNEYNVNMFLRMNNPIPDLVKGLGFNDKEINDELIKTLSQFVDSFMDSDYWKSQRLALYYKQMIELYYSLIQSADNKFKKLREKVECILKYFKYVIGITSKCKNKYYKSESYKSEYCKLKEGSNGLGFNNEEKELLNEFLHTNKISSMPKATVVNFLNDHGLYPNIIEYIASLEEERKKKKDNQMEQDYDSNDSEELEFKIFWELISYFRDSVTSKKLELNGDNEFEHLYVRTIESGIKYWDYENTVGFIIKLLGGFIIKYVGFVGLIKGNKLSNENYSEFLKLIELDYDEKTQIIKLFWEYHNLTEDDFSSLIKDCKLLKDSYNGGKIENVDSLLSELEILKKPDLLKNLYEFFFNGILVDNNLFECYKNNEIDYFPDKRGNLIYLVNIYPDYLRKATGTKQTQKKFLNILNERIKFISSIEI
ncbi:MAG: hypothetical protein N4A49_06435 [Marinifilaceae bacterium]|jgi:hypothetical protein|nr:hypothetical protein [Marinifilaceae bacterium]